jgi:hypothetical protein
LRRRLLHILSEFDVKEADASIGLFIVMPHSSKLYAREVLSTLDEHLTAIVSRPLSPRNLQTLLGITGGERLRWTREGRLPREGSAFIRKGQLISLATYAVAPAEHLAQHPEIIANWREDAAAA